MTCEPTIKGTLSRRAALASAAGALLVPMVAPSVFAAGVSLGRSQKTPGSDERSYIYGLHPVPIAAGVWLVPGAADKITAKNGGAIANVVIFDTSDGVTILDTGPSHRYGTELKTLAYELTGKPVARVFLTHIHADHSLGATAFDSKALYGANGLAADLKLRGNAITDAMYRVAGDWMRGTNVPEPQHVATDGVEQIGQRKFRCLTLSGHTANDLCLYEETSGLLLTGDLVFLDRAPTTPDADIPAWRRSLATIADIPHAKLVPGHGPVEPGRRGIDQTRRWLDFVDGAVTSHFDQGLDETEMMATAMPDWTKDIAVSRYEYQRSVMHLTPRLEAAQLPVLA